MNQSFKKKVIAASVAATFVAVGAGFVAIPGIAPISAAQANQFADTTQEVAVSAGVNVPASATAALTGQTFYINESVGAALSTGQIVISPSSGSKFVSASAASSKTAGTTALVVEPTQVDSNGNLVISISGASSADVTGSKIAITSIVMNTSSASVGSTVTATISTSSTVTGLTKGVTTTLANVAAAGATVASAATTATKVATGQTLTMDQINVTETILTSFANNATVGADVTIELPSGLTWVAAPTMATLSGTDVTNGGTANTAGNKLSSTGAGYAKASYYFDGDVSASASAVKFSGGTVFVPSGTAVGDLNATVVVYKNNAVLSTSTVKIGQIVNSGTTASFVEASGTSATVDYNTLFAGRNYAGGLSTGVGAEADTLKVAEVVGASMSLNGTVTLALSTGKFGAAPTKTDTTVVLGAGSLSTDAKTSTYAVSTATTTTAGNSVFTLGNLDMSAATAGDLNVVVGGTAGVTAATVKMADVVNATSASVAAGAETVTANTVFTIPTITITEGKYSALAAANVIGIELPAGYTIQKGTADATDGTTLTNGTHVTVKVVDTTGADVTTTALGASPTLTIGNGAAGTARQLFITMSNASGNAAGTYTITVTGLKAKSSSSATAGDINAVIAGADSAGTSTVAAMTVEDASSWTSKASATKATVAVGKIVAATVGDFIATATGASTALTLSSSAVAAGNDQGKIGTLFVVAVLPNGQVYSRDSAGAWTLWDGVTAFKAVEAGVTLGTHTVQILSTATDVSSIVGTQVYVGYGIGALGTSAYTNLLANATYKKVYTVQ